jgi:hypothetical protein
MRGDIRDFVRSAGGLLYGVAILVGCGAGVAVALMAWHWFATVG